MKQLLHILLTGLLFVVGITDKAAGQVDTVTVLHVNDTHSHLVPHGPKDDSNQSVGTRGGFARVAALISGIQEAEENVLFLHGGDLFVGDFMFNKYLGVAELQLLAQLGCDALTLGNHEFDLTPDVLKLALTEAGFPMPGFDILSANLDMSADPDLAALVQPYTIRDVGNLRVGIFGLTTEATNEGSLPAPVIITSYLEAAQASVEDLEQECDVIMALSHIGYYLDRVLAETVAGIDLIVGGHSHDTTPSPVAVTNPEGETTWIVQAGSYYNYVGSLRFTHGPGRIEILSYELMPVDSSVVEDSDAAIIVQSLVQDLEADPRYGPVYTDVIAEAGIDIERDFQEAEPERDTPMGNLITDACRDLTGTDIAMTVLGIISRKLYAGPLTGADIFRTIPYGYDEATGYGYTVVTFEMTGLELLWALEFTTEQAESRSDLFVQVSGMSFEYYYDQPFGHKINWVRIGDEELDLFTTYTVTTNAGINEVLDLVDFEPGDIQDTGITEYHAVRDYIIANVPIDNDVEGRILRLSSAAEDDKSDQLPMELRTCWSYPNPFSRETSILYSLLTDCRVRLEVYDHAGRRMATLIDQWQRAGAKKLLWNAKSFQSGAYYYRLTAGDFAITGRMILRR